MIMPLRKFEMVNRRYTEKGMAFMHKSNLIHHEENSGWVALRLKHLKKETVCLFVCLFVCSPSSRSRAIQTIPFQGWQTWEDHAALPTNGLARESGNLKGLVLGYNNAIFTRENKKARRRARTETGQRKQREQKADRDTKREDRQRRRTEDKRTGQRQRKEKNTKTKSRKGKKKKNKKSAMERT